MRGFIVGALSLAGFAAGAFLGTRLAPALLSGGSASPYAPMFGLLGALIGGAVLAGGLEGLGLRLRALVRLPGFGVFDGILGAALSVAVALGIVWIAGAVALQTPGARVLRKEIQRSAILQRLNDVLPPSGSVLNALARFDPFPDIAGPLADVPAAERRDRARPGGPGGRRIRRARARHGVRAGGERLGLGGGARRGGDQRPRRSRGRTTPPSSCAGRARCSTRQRSRSTPTDDIAVLRVRRPRRAAARDGAERAGRGAGRDPRLPARRALRRARRPDRADPHRRQPGRLRARVPSSGA